MSAIEPKHRLSPSGPRLPTEEDHKVLVDETDETPGFLASKVAAGPGIVLAVLPGVNKKVQISAPGSTIDEQVKITAADGSAGYLGAKLVAGANVALTVLPPLANETLRVDVASAPPSGPAGGDLGGTYPSPSVDALTESFGPTSLPLGSIPAGSVLARIGGSIVGVAPPNPVLFWGAGNVAGTAVTRFLRPGYQSGVAPVTGVQLPITRAGTLQRMFVRCRVAGAGVTNITYTVLLNGVATTLLVAMLPTAVSASNVVNTVIVAAGDYIEIQVTKAAIGSSPTDIEVCIEEAA